MFILNPANWNIDFEYNGPNDFTDDFNPKMHLVIIKLLMFKIEIIIDDGSW